MLLIPSRGSRVWQDKQHETEASIPMSSANYVSASRPWASIYLQTGGRGFDATESQSPL